MGMPSGTELLLIFGIIVLLFGAKKIPELAKGVGKGIKNFKAEMNDDTPTATASAQEVKEVEANQEVASTTQETKTTTQA